MSRWIAALAAALCVVSVSAFAAPMAGADVTETENVTVETAEMPRLRLQQNAGPLPAQSWDLAGNQAGFFVRDHSHGDLVPFLISPEAPTDSLTVGSMGRVGLGTATTNGTIGALQIDSYNEARVVFRETAIGTPRWSAGIPMFENAFGIGLNNESPILKLLPYGDAEVAGSVSEAVNTGTVSAVQNIKPDEILAKVRTLPIRSWRLSGAPTGDRHLGPLADTFGPAFGLGHNVQHISAADVGGVALASIQALAQKNSVLEASNGESANANRALEQRLSGVTEQMAGVTAVNGALEARLGGLAKQLKSLRKAVKKLQK